MQTLDVIQQLLPGSYSVPKGDLSKILGTIADLKTKKVVRVTKIFFFCV